MEIIKNKFITNSQIYKIDISFEIEDIANKLITLTNKNNRILDTNNKIVDNKIYNPYLVIQIIDRIFAEAAINNQKGLTRKNIINAVKVCNKIKENVKEDFINNIKNLDSEIVIKTFKNKR